MNKQRFIECRQLVKTFSEQESDIRVLDHVNVTISPGDEIAIMGVSGSGKTTLLQLLGGLDHPTEGQVFWDGQDLKTLKSDQIAKKRNEQLGFIYQFHHLLPEFTALENVAMVLRVRRVPVKEAMEQAVDMLSEVGLAHRLSHLPTQLSGGERQRVAIARAMVSHPSYILADEPTGNLDRKTAESVFELLKTLREKRNAALVVVTHDVSIAQNMQQQWTLADGALRITRGK